jgi:hypothetical protein
MIYSATIKQAGETAGTWIVTPLYTRVDGLPAPDILALAANGIEPVAGDIVLCAESINPFDHSSVRSFDNNGGSCPIIIATFAELFTTLLDIVIKGKTTLGAGTYKMVLGDPLATWAQSVDTALSTLSAAVGSVLPAITPSLWQATNLSENHKLD